MNDCAANRRDLLFARLLAAAASAFGPATARVAGVDPTQSIVKLPDQIPWQPLCNVPPGSFVHRVARTPQDDGIKSGIKEPAIIAISRIGPIRYHLTDTSKPGWRAV
ncbi:hypothetical protein ACRAWG_26850 [Methylobacterium sp. P31]